VLLLHVFVLLGLFFGDMLSDLLERNVLNFSGMGRKNLHQQQISYYLSIYSTSQSSLETTEEVFCAGGIVCLHCICRKLKVLQC